MIAKITARRICRKRFGSGQTNQAAATGTSRRSQIGWKIVIIYRLPLCRRRAEIDGLIKTPAPAGRESRLRKFPRAGVRPIRPRRPLVHGGKWRDRMLQRKAG